MTDAVPDADPLPPRLRFLAGGGAATRLILARDWTGHPLGEPAGWPEGLKTALSLLLNSPESMLLCWGRDTLTFFFNEAYVPLLGPRVDWAMGEPFKQVWADAWAQARPIIDDAFAGRSQRFTDLPWKLGTDRGPADTWFTFSYSRILDVEGAIAGLFVFTNETTARVLADQALARSQEELRALNADLERQVAERTAERDRMWQTAPDLMLVIDFAGVFRRVNPAWTSTLGYQPDELIGHHVNEFVLPEDHGLADHAVAQAAQGVMVRTEVRYRHKDESVRWISWTAAPAGELTYATGRDITEEKERAAELAQAQALLRQAQKMEAVGQLTGGLAHDFNNLLTGVMGNLELLGLRLSRGKLDDAERFIAAAQGAGKRAAALTQRLLAFSRRQTLDPKPTDVNRLIAGMEELLRRTIGPENQLEVIAQADLWPACVDAGQLENAVLNLCLNARDAMPGGGTLTIETANIWLDEREGRERELPHGDYLLVSVADTGTGMDAATAERAFEPFFTTKPLGQGTGLGLSMIYGFARQSGGHVRAFSEAGEGTAMCLYLPRHLGEAPEDAPVASPQLAGAGRGTVLIVDDEATIRHLLDEVLDDLGYTVIGAADGAAGIKVLQSGARIDLLITDVGLPGGLNGRQVADAARALRPGLKVLFITGYAAEDAAVGNGHLEPGMELLTKPFSLESLSAKVGEMMRG